MVDKYGVGQDPYTYKNSTVLINKFNIRDEAILEEAEKEFTLIAAVDIEFQSPPYDFQYLCNLHKNLFRDLFEWAGELRTIDISKGQTRFCNYRYIEKEANLIFAKLAKENYLLGLSLHLLIEKLAEYYCDINALHPFREGNGRAQRLLFEHLVINCGYSNNFETIESNERVDANIQGYHCDYSLMEDILKKCVVIPKSNVGK
jgi:cell filamentation protein